MEIASYDFDWSLKLDTMYLMRVLRGARALSQEVNKDFGMTIFSLLDTFATLTSEGNHCLSLSVLI
jgi:hypothetical protein